MAVTDILELRILPPFAIGRLGSSPDPMDNYELRIRNPVGFRVLEPAPTLIVDRATGEITSLSTPRQVSFRDSERKIRPISPFLEVWACFEKDGPLLPLTSQHLDDLGLTPSDIKWSVHVGNIKAYRRTGDAHDKIESKTGLFSDHGLHELAGLCDNFITGKSIPLGSVQYIKPNAAFPEIRLRFTPAMGKVYGPQKDSQPQEGAGKKFVPEEVYDSHKGTWKGYADDGQSRLVTNPGEIYAGDSVTDPKTQATRFISRGFLDDECDGIVDVELILGDKTLKAYTRIAAGPPTFAPDSLPVRTISDEIEQAMFGPDVTSPVSEEEVADIVRRALETVRLMNTDMMNRGSTERGVGMARMDTFDVARALEPIMDPAVVDSLAIRARHERVLLSLEGGSLAWFARVLREYDQVGDLTNEGRRKMPAMMRGADGRHLALTRRQVNKVRAAAEQMSKTVQDSENGK